jgi:ABC-type transport system involved in multi-copper enzyme maturation permease subunit
MHSDYFAQFSWTVFSLAALFVFLKIAVLGAVVVLFSTLTSNSFITLIFSISVFIVGTSVEDVLFFLRSGLAAQDVAVSKTLWIVIEVVSYLVPNLAVFDYKISAAHGLMPAWGQLGLSLGYGAVYIVVLLVVASCVFSRREFN